MSNYSDNGIKGPIAFDGVTEHVSFPVPLEKHEWRRKLRSSNGGTLFRITYYGDRMESLIIATEHAPQKVVATDVSTGETMIIFDGCSLGYNALFCDDFPDDVKNGRTTDAKYVHESGVDTFEIILSAYYGIDYDNEFLEEVDENGMIELIGSHKDSFENVKRNGCDTFQIIGLMPDGSSIEIISEELA